MNELELAARLQEAEKAFYTIDMEWITFKTDLEQEYRHLARVKGEEEFKAKFATQYTELQNYRDTILKEYTEYMDEKHVLEAQGSLPYPEGTILNRVKLVGWSRTEKVISEETGILQVFKKGDVYNKKSRWSIPTVGDIVVRELKKDGTPSKNVVRYRAPEWHFNNRKEETT